MPVTVTALQPQYGQSSSYPGAVLLPPISFDTTTSNPGCCWCKLRTVYKCPCCVQRKDGNQETTTHAQTWPQSVTHMFTVHGSHAFEPTYWPAPLVGALCSVLCNELDSLTRKRQEVLLRTCTGSGRLKLDRNSRLSASSSPLLLARLLPLYVLFKKCGQHERPSFAGYLTAFDVVMMPGCVGEG